MKKAFAILMCIIMLALSGCKPGGESQAPEVPVEESSLRVLMDLDMGSNIVEPKLKRALEKYLETEDGGFQSFQSTIKALGGPEKLELEFPPVQGNEREMYLTSLRTEIMAGKGPDVFVCDAGPSFVTDLAHISNGTVGGGWSEPVFNFPRQAMKRNMFLPLDKYIPDFQFTDWERLTPVIMDAGKYGDKQYLLPMTYTLPMTVFKKSSFQHTPSKEMTWEDMLSGGPELKAAASLDTSVYQGSALMPMAAGDKDELAFTEEELLSFMKEKIKAREETLQNKDLPANTDCWLASGFTDNYLPEGFTSDDGLTMVPLYSREGGCGATITSFAGVNANTESPKAAAFFVDYLLSEECQLSGLYAYPLTGSSVPVMEGLMQKDTAIPCGDSGSWCLSPENYEGFCALRDSITRAEFATPLGKELSGLCGEMMDYNKRKSAESRVHDAYMRMNMMLAES